MEVYRADIGVVSPLLKCDTSLGLSKCLDEHRTK